MTYKIIVGILFIIGVGLVGASFILPGAAGRYMNVSSTSIATSSLPVEQPVSNTSANSQPIQATPSTLTPQQKSTAMNSLYEASIKSNVDAVITNAVIDQSTSGGSYGTDSNTSCASAMTSASIFSHPDIKNTLEDIIKSGSAQQTCEVYGSGTSIAISAQLLVDPTKWYCQDSNHPSVTTTGDTLSGSSGGCE